MQNYVIRVVLALALAILSAVANFFWLQSQKPQLSNYLAFATDVKKGKKIDPSDLKPISLPKESNVNGVFLPYSNIGLLLGVNASRDYKANELVTNDVVTTTNEPPQYDVLGPFRLISVDSKIIGVYNDDNKAEVSGNAVTIAVNYTGGNSENSGFNSNTRRLLQIVERSKIRNNPDEDLKIRGIVVYREDQEIKTEGKQSLSVEKEADPEKIQFDIPEKTTKDDSQRTQNIDLRPNEIALFVPLPNVPTIPNVILSNKAPMIGFVVSSNTIPKE